MATATTPPPDSTPTLWSWLPGPVFPNYQPASLGGHRVRSRKLWGGEVLFARGALLAPGRADLIIRTTLSLPDQQENAHGCVRAALRTMRWNHPSIASRIVWDEAFSAGKFVYEAPEDEAAVGAWLDQVAFLRTAGEEGVEKAADSLVAELASFRTQRTGDELKVYHVAPSSSSSSSGDGEKHEIAMYFRHELFDGVCAWETAGVFLSELATALGAPSCASATPLEWGNELERLARPVPDRVGPEAEWSPKDLHGDWPMVKNIKKALARPSSNYGLPYPGPAAATHLGTGMSSKFKITKFSPETFTGLLRATRAHGVKLFATQFAMNLVACMRTSPLPDNAADEEQEQRVTWPCNAVNLRRTLNTVGQAELVSALGFNAIDARDLGRFVALGAEQASEQEILDAIWTLAREIQAQLTMQAEWDKDFVKCAPIMLQTLGSWLKDAPLEQAKTTPQMSNMGALDSFVHHSYPVGAEGQAVMKVLDVAFHNIIFHVTVHTYTWRGELHHSYQVPEIVGGEVKEKEVVGKYVRELERLTKLVAGDTKEDCVRDTRH